MDLSILPPPPPTALPSSFILCRNIYMYTRSPYPLPARVVVHMAVAHARRPPAFAARLCAPCRVPASAAVFRVRLPPPVVHILKRPFLP